VKKLKIWKSFSDTMFVKEINCLMRASTKHHNVVRFLGYCAESYGEVVPFNGGYVIAEVPQGCYASSMFLMETLRSISKVKLAVFILP
jgi:hypothetical protein